MLYSLKKGTEDMREQRTKAQVKKQTNKKQKQKLQDNRLSFFHDHRQWSISNDGSPMIIFHDTLSFKSNIYFYISFFFSFQNELSRRMCCSSSCSNCFEQGEKWSRKKRKLWVKPWVSWRNERGMYNNLIQELRNEDIDKYVFQIWPLKNLINCWVA